MSERRIITVFGATGSQGGGLARSILADPEGPFAVRAVTRDATSPAAKALAKAGAEVVVADVDDAAAVARALEGAHGPVQAALIVGAVSLALAFAATWVLGETFGKDLDYTEV